MNTTKVWPMVRAGRRWVTFGNPDGPDFAQLRVDHSVWVKMGRPVELTVTMATS